MTVDWFGVVPDLDIYIFFPFRLFSLLLLTLFILCLVGYLVVCVSFVFLLSLFQLSFVIVVVVSEIESGSFFFVFPFCRATGKRADGWGGRPVLSLCVCVVQLWLLLCA